MYYKIRKESSDGININYHFPFTSTFVNKYDVCRGQTHVISVFVIVKSNEPPIPKWNDGKSIKWTFPFQVPQ